MPPNSTVERLTSGSSVRSGVYSGSNVTSWPRATSSAASALSRRQLPQYMPPAPAVMERIFMRRETLPGRTREPRAPLQRRPLKRARAEQKFDDVAFVRLEPVELDGRNRTEIQSIDVNRVDQRATELGPARDRAAHECRPDLLEHLRFRAVHDRDEREHVFLLRDRGLRRVAVDDRRQQIFGARFLHDTGSVAMLRGHVGDPGRLQV